MWCALRLPTCSYQCVPTQSAEVTINITSVTYTSPPVWTQWAVLCCATTTVPPCVCQCNGTHSYLPWPVCTARHTSLTHQHCIFLLATVPQSPWVALQSQYQHLYAASHTCGIPVSIYCLAPSLCTIIAAEAYVQELLGTFTFINFWGRGYPWHWILASLSRGMFMYSPSYDFFVHIYLILSTYSSNLTIIPALWTIVHSLHTEPRVWRLLIWSTYLI